MFTEEKKNRGSRLVSIQVKLYPETIELQFVNIRTFKNRHFLQNFTFIQIANKGSSSLKVENRATTEIISLGASRKFHCLPES